MKFEIYSLGEVSKNFDSKRIPLSKLERSKMAGEYPYYGAAKIMDYVNDYIFDGQYLLVAEDGTILDENGRPVLQLVNGKFWVNNHTHVLQGNHICRTEYLYYLLSQIDISGYTTGSVLLKLNQKNLNRIELTIPSLESQDKIISFIRKFDKEISIRKQINRNSKGSVYGV